MKWIRIFQMMILNSTRVLASRKILLLRNDSENTADQRSTKEEIMVNVNFSRD